MKKLVWIVTFVFLTFFTSACSVLDPVFDADANPNQIGFNVENPARLGEYAVISSSNKKNSIEICVKEVIGGEEAKKLIPSDVEFTVFVVNVRVNKMVTTEVSISDSINIVKKNGVLDKKILTYEDGIKGLDFIGDLKFGAAGSSDAFFIFDCDINDIKAIAYNGENYTTYFSIDK